MKFYKIFAGFFLTIISLLLVLDLFFVCLRFCFDLHECARVKSTRLFLIFQNSWDGCIGHRRYRLDWIIEWGMGGGLGRVQDKWEAESRITSLSRMIFCFWIYIYFYFLPTSFYFWQSKKYLKTLKFNLWGIKNLKRTVSKSAQTINEITILCIIRVGDKKSGVASSK